MAVQNQSITLFRGNKIKLRFTVTDEDQAGSPAKPLTGLVIKFSLAKFDDAGNPIRANPLLDFASDDASPQVVITDSVNGIVEVTLLKVDTEGLSPSDYYVELEAFDVSGESVVVATGTLTLLQNVLNA